uniref:Neurochondrin n=1 Tax=Knipowitschia caucasica TaxID=637954 RepID=A0AAV2K464_KNICA
MGAETNGGLREETRGRLSEAQAEVLERCLHALKHAKNDSHLLAALLLITRLCPANQLDQMTLRRIFEAVGLNLPARLLVTAVRGSSDGSGLAPNELLSLGTALLAALSTDPDMAYKPQLLSTVPLLLQILSTGPQPKHRDDNPTGGDPTCQDSHRSEAKPEHKDNSETKPEQGGDNSSENKEPHVSFQVDEAIAADCYQVLLSVCAQPLGPEQLLSRGAVRALCQAVLRDQTLSREQGLPLLAFLLSGKTKTKAWSRNCGEVLGLLDKLTEDFSKAPERDRLKMCVTLVPFVPALAEGSERARGVVRRVWAVLRPMLQSKLTPKQMGPVLVLGACLLDVCGWEEVGSPKFCCLLVNRACVELRMELEEPPGSSLSPETQHTITACYRIMEAAMEQACMSESQAPVHSSVPGLSLQQSRQVLRVLEEAFSAVIYHLRQVDESRFGEPFVFASFRSLCSWLAEETSCLREEVTMLLPFLIGYCRSHMSGGEQSELSDWIEQESVAGEQRWTGKEPLRCLLPVSPLSFMHLLPVSSLSSFRHFLSLFSSLGYLLHFSPLSSFNYLLSALSPLCSFFRYLLPALGHLSAEADTRKVLLSLDAPLLLVQFVSESWERMRDKNVRDPSVETACSALLNITVTEANAIRYQHC